MKPIKLAFAALLAVLSAAWIAADTLWPNPFGYFAFRTVFVQYSGVLAIGLMSVAMVLALRPRWLESRLDGLDKMYRLHKWLGVGALVVGTLHWWWAQGTKWMVGWGWLQRPARGAQPDLSGLGWLEGLLRQQRGLAESVGEWAFYAMVVFIVLALARRFPYHLFARTHKLIAWVYLLLVFHSVVLTKFAYWRQPIGWLLIVLMSGGTFAAIVVLLGRVGAGRQVRGKVSAVVHYPALDVIESSVELDPGWPGHAAGQFAFVTSDRREGAHPYTIASAWQESSARITFITKALGDHTARLRERLHVGMPVTVEGPYGCFDFDDHAPCQIWIGAGIGITPFVARLKQLAAEPHTQVVHLFHPTAVLDPAAMDKLRADAAAAGIQLHIVDTAKQGRLSGDRIRAGVPDWARSSIWFCGPAPYGEALRRDFLRRGLKRSRFHQELFEMR